MTQWGSFLFLGAVLVVIGGIAGVFGGDYEIGGVTVHIPDLATIAERDTTAGESISVEEQMRRAEEATRLRAAEIEDSIRQVYDAHAKTMTENISAGKSAMHKVDSIRFSASDSARLYRHFFTTSDVAISYPGNDPAYLFPALRAMRGATDHVVSVFHYGDSQIEADRITHLLRDSLQALFGGSGPGVLPLWQPIPTRSVKQSLSDSVSTFFAGGIMGSRGKVNRYGARQIASHLAGQEVTMSITSNDSKSYSHVRVYAGKVGDLTVTVNKETKVVKKAKESVEYLDWTFKARKEIEIDLGGTAEIYGVEVDGGKGVAVTNVPLRGSDGLYFSRCDEKTLSQMLRDLNTRLILLEFGGNALPVLTDSAGVRKYAEGFGRQIALLQRLCPEASMIMIGPADMSVKVGTKMQTHELLPYLTKELRRTSMEHGIAYWDMYTVMGGWNSMPAWVEHKPAWAAPDYIHFTIRGAHRIATILWRNILMTYNYMELRERLGDDEGEASER